MLVRLSVGHIYDARVRRVPPVWHGRKSIGKPVAAAKLVVDVRAKPKVEAERASRPSKVYVVQKSAGKVAKAAAPADESAGQYVGLRQTLKAVQRVGVAGLAKAGCRQKEAV